MYSVCGPQASLWDRTVEFVQQTATRVRGWFETVRQKFRAQRTKGASCRNTCRDGKIFARCTNVVLWNCALFLAAFGKVGLGQGNLTGQFQDATAPFQIGILWLAESLTLRRRLS